MNLWGYFNIHDVPRFCARELEQTGEEGGAQSQSKEGKIRWRR